MFDVIAKINIYAPMLISANDTVLLKIKHVYHGQFGVIQAVLVPERLLKANTEYKLELSGLPYEASQFWKRHVLSWTTGPKKDLTPPQWHGSPSIANSEYKEYGCGPAIYVDIKVPAKNNQGQPYVIVDLFEKDSKDKISYIIDIDKMYKYEIVL